MVLQAPDKGAYIARMAVHDTGLDGDVIHDLAVADDQDSIGIRGDAGFVGDHDRRL